MYKCEYCNCDFTPKYFVASTQNPRFCSKSCATFKQNNKNYSQKYLEDKVEKVIRRKGRYVTASEIKSELKISSKTLNKYQVSIIKANKNCGFKKPPSMFQFLVGNCIEGIFGGELVEYEKTFEDLLSPSGYKLRLDFYVASLNLAIEADGSQHYQEGHFYDNGKVQEYDQIKNDYCLENGIFLVRIPYKKLITQDYVESHLKVFFDHLDHKQSEKNC